MTRFWATAAALLFAVGSATAGEAKRPNVLIVLTDDQGYGDFSCHGNPVLKTPNLDRLHGQSVRFVDFHSAPMCTPSRGQILTGVDALRNGATSVTAGRAFLRRGMPTLPQIFALAGYRTGIFGKWHLGDNYPHRPIDRGFHKAVYHLGWGVSAAPEFANTLFDGRYFEDGEPKKFTGHMTDFWFDRATAWMKERRERDEPFVCYLPTNAPHAPHVVDAKWSAPYAKLKQADFFGMIAQIDANVGKMLAFIESSGLAENTIVVFMTDNGGTAGVPIFNAGMRGMKTTYYEGGHRVPCWVRWPAGKLRAPSDVTDVAQMQDVLPTLMDLCRVQRPASAIFDGVSLARVLRDPAAKLDDRTLIVQYGQTPKKHEACVLWNRWRLVHGTELYDLASDPGQKSEVGEKHPAIAKKLRDHYETWWAAVAGKLTDFVPTHVGSRTQSRTSLTSSDWRDIYCDNAGHVRTAVGGEKGGVWSLEVESAGAYEIALRRWPEETGLPLGGDAGGKGKFVSRVIRPASVRVSVAGKEYGASTAPDRSDAVVRVVLPAGPTTLQAWFVDAEGRPLCGAFYATVERK